MGRGWQWHGPLRARLHSSPTLTQRRPLLRTLIAPQDLSAAADRDLGDSSLGATFRQYLALLEAGGALSAASDGALLVLLDFVTAVGAPRGEPGGAPLGGGWRRGRACSAPLPWDVLRPGLCGMRRRALRPPCARAPAPAPPQAARSPCCSARASWSTAGRCTRTPWRWRAP